MTSTLEVLRASLATFVIWQAGYLFVRLLRVDERGLLETASLAFGFGLGAVALEMSALGMAGIRLSATVVCAPWAVGWVAYLIRRRALIRWPRVAFPALTAVEWILLAALLLTSGAIVFQATFHPVFEWDGWAMWDLKARAFFIDRSLRPYLTDSYYQLSHPEYPLLQPLAGTFIYLMVGRLTTLVLLIPAVLYVALAGLIYVALRRHGAGRALALALTLLCAWLPNTLFWSKQFYAETALLFYALGSALYLWEYLQRPARAPLVVAAVLAGLVTQVKVEGLALVLPSLLMLLLRALRKRSRAEFFGAGLYAFALTGFYLPWFAYQRALTPYAGHLSAGNVAAALQNLARLPEIAGVALAWMFQWRPGDSLLFVFSAGSVLVFLTAPRWAQQWGHWLWAAQTAASVLAYSLFFLVNPQFLSVDNFGRYLLELTNVLAVWMALLAVEQFSAGRWRRWAVSGALAGLLLLPVILDVWPGAPSPANFFSRPVGSIQYAFSQWRSLWPAALPQREAFFDDKVGGPEYTRLVRLAQAVTPDTEALVLWARPDDPNLNYLIQRSYYLLYPRKVFVVTADSLPIEALTQHNAATLLVYRRDPQLPPGLALVAQLTDQSVLARVSTAAAALLEQPGVITAPVAFANGITLRGVQWLPPATGDESLALLFWQTSQSITQSLTAFVHVFEGETFVAQSDATPAQGRLPTFIWPLNELIVDAHSLPLMHWAGKTFCIGLYDSSTPMLERVPVLSAEGYALSENRACRALP